MSIYLHIILQTNNRPKMTNEYMNTDLSCQSI